MRWIYLFISLFLITLNAARAVVKTSQENGAWEAIAWLPAGTPDAGDTVVINSNVTGMYGGNFAQLVVAPGKRLEIALHSPQVEELLNYGTIEIAQGRALVVMGSVLNNGILAGDGRIEMIGSGTILRGTGTFESLAVNIPGGGRLQLGDSLSLASLSIGDRDTLDIGSYNLAVRGSYLSASAEGRGGVVGTTGITTLMGPVFGVVATGVVVADPPTGPASRRTLAEISGSLGMAGGEVRFRSSRRIDFTRLIGRALVDSGATLVTAGIGGNGWVRADGPVLVYGTITADDPALRWEVADTIVNRGLLEGFTLMMTGARGLIASDSGSWDEGMSILYRASSGGRLTLRGGLTLSSLVIAGAGSADSNIVVDAGSWPLTVRHLFQSDAARGNGIRSDSVVRLRSEARGMVAGSTVFDGFWDARISGRYGRAGGYARIAAPKSAVGSFDVLGDLIVDKPYLLALDTGATAIVAGGGSIAGRLDLGVGGRLDVAGDLVVERGIEGAGRLRLLGMSRRLSVTGNVGQSVVMEIGDGERAASAVLDGHGLSVPRLVVRAGSAIDAADGEPIVVTREYRHEVAYNAGTVPASSPCRADGTADGTEAMMPGSGYWRSFERPTTVAGRGGFVGLPLSIPVRAGWNLIGGASVPAPAYAVTAEGTRIASGFFLYDADGRAARAETIEPGSAYWVRVESDGVLVLHAGR